MKESSLKT